MAELREELVERIVSGEQHDYFDVIGWEPGTGKTLTAYDGIVQAVERGRRVLLVRYTAENTQEAETAINDRAGKVIAAAFHSRRYVSNAAKRDFLDCAHEWPVVVITHKRYQLLSADVHQRNQLVAGRSILIIDEFPDMVEEVAVDLETIHALEEVLSRFSAVRQLFREVVAGIEDGLILMEAETGSRYVRLSEAPAEETWGRLSRLIREQCDGKKLCSWYRYLVSEEEVPDVFGKEISIGALCKRIEGLRLFYESTSVYSGGKLIAADPGKWFWTIDGVNILLDASGDFQPAYRVNPELFRKRERKSVLDHSRWTIEHVRCNTTSYGQSRIDNFYKCVQQRAEEYGPKTLLVGSKRDMDKLDQIEADRKTYHHNLIGSNQWRDMENVIVCKTPAVSDAVILLRYLYYARGASENLPCADVITGPGRREYADQRLEEFRVLDRVNHVYQAVKRVNRDMSRDTAVVLIMEDEQVVRLLAECLKGCEVKTVSAAEWGFDRSAKERYDERRRENSYAEKFKRLSLEILRGGHRDLEYRPKSGRYVPGKFKKKTIQDYLGVGDTSNFRRLVLEKGEVTRFCEEHHITISRCYIEFPAQDRLAA